ncbi:MAG TPA: VOC family protein [Flavisolibacter sp.]|nr:VOC family protein [Flavisolibacter sp.]
MATKIFVNLPVKDLEKSKEFFTKIGFTINPQFTDDKAACVVISEDIFAMILREEFFKTFIPRTEIADATKATEVLVALSAESKEGVDELANKAIAAGGSQLREPEDHGFMYSKSFQDLDGHIWEVVWMDMAAVPPAP